jgi:4-amino-4-deoxy-L-arabinose transferase-like glycosyltransferase
MPRRLYVFLIFAILLRFALGAIAFFYLPNGGYNSKPERAGYLFLDAYRRDSQARDLAQSDRALSRAFDQKFSSDQYGGLLWLSALVYRFVNPHPLTMILLAALCGAVGGVFVYLTGRQLFDEKTALLAAAIFFFYPESILFGAAQMREPFLMTLLTMAFFGVVSWQGAQRGAWLWLAAAMGGMLLISPGFVLVSLVAAAGWLYLAGAGRRIPWQAAVAGLVLFLVALVVLSASWDALVAVKGGGALGVIANWARETARWNAQVLKRSSGIVQLLFENLPRGLALPFVAVYGILQPVLPAALIEPGILFWQTLGIFRALGWYLLLPWVAFAPFSAWGISGDLRGRRQWVWLSLVVWAWILIAALRGGGDQWDNPRYRVILLGWMALLAARTFYAPKTRWLWRILAVEAILLLVFTHWYTFRYWQIGFNLGIRNTLALALGAALLLTGFDLLWQARKRKNTL